MSTSLAPSLDISNFNVVLTVLGAFVSVFGLISYVVKERLYISDSLVAVLLGIALGPRAANIFRVEEYGNVDEITLAFTRLVIGVQLVLAGIQLPSLYLWKQWKSIAMLLLPIMTLKWIISAVVIEILFSISFLESLAVAACITPTDPVLANAIVKGKYAEKYVSAHLRNIISAEAGANDGFGYPFLFLAIYLLKIPKGGIAIEHWIVHTLIYEILFSVIYGLVLGLLARLALKFTLQRKWVDNEAFLSYFIALSLFVIGSCGLIGTDDLLAAFLAGNAFSLGDFYREETADDSLQTSMDMLLNQAVFVWIGATMPWDQMEMIDPGWRILTAAILILTLGRLPAMLCLYRFIPEVKSLKEAFFAGWFGPSECLYVLRATKLTRFSGCRRCLLCPSGYALLRRGRILLQSPQSPKSIGLRLCALFNHSAWDNSAADHDELTHWSYSHVNQSQPISWAIINLGYPGSCVQAS